MKSARRFFRAGFTCPYALMSPEPSGSAGTSPSKNACKQKQVKQTLGDNGKFVAGEGDARLRMARARFDRSTAAGNDLR